MKLARLFLTFFCISTSVNAGLAPDPAGIEFPDVLRGCESQTKTVRVSWTDLDGYPLVDFTAMMAGNSDEFDIRVFGEADEGCLFNTDETGDTSISIADEGSCYIEITMLPNHPGIKKKRINLDGFYGEGDLINDVSGTIPVTGTSYPPNSPNHVERPQGCCLNPYLMDEETHEYICY